jgi:hypothetical protein
MPRDIAVCRIYLYSSQAVNMPIISQHTPNLTNSHRALLTGKSCASTGNQAEHYFVPSGDDPWLNAPNATTTTIAPRIVRMVRELGARDIPIIWPTRCSIPPRLAAMLSRDGWRVQDVWRIPSTSVLEVAFRLQPHSGIRVSHNSSNDFLVF